MQVKRLLSVGALALALGSWNVAAQADGQAAPEAGAEFTTTVFTEPLPGSPQVDIWYVTCAGPTTAIGAFVCDTGTLDDSFILSIAGDTPGTLTQGDRGFIRGPSAPGGCTVEAFTGRPAGSSGTIKAYVSVQQTADSSSNSYDLHIQCYGATTKNATAKLVRDRD